MSCALALLNWIFDALSWAFANTFHLMKDTFV